MNIEGVPDSVPWSKVEAFLTDLGLDLGKMPSGRGGITIGDKDIRCVVYAFNSDGRRYVDGATKTVAVHEVRIPITDAPWMQRKPVAESDIAADTCVHVI